MKLVRNNSFSSAKLRMLFGAKHLNLTPAFPSRVVGKWVHQNHLSSLSDCICHLYASIWLSGYVVPLYTFRCGSLVVVDMSYSWSSGINGDVC